MTIRKRMTRVNIGFAATVSAISIYYFFGSALSQIFSNDGFMPHGHCYLWSPALVGTMVLSNALIGVAYFAISLCLYFLVKRINLPFSAMFLAFGVFIGACGLTHFMDIYTLWQANYWLAAFINVITAVASVATAVLIFPLMPKVESLSRTAKISDERKAELESAYEELAARNEQLSALNRELEAFSYSVSHDLRAPLRGIDGFSLALLEDYSDKLDETAKEYLGFVREGTQQMGRVIDDLLRLSRISRSEIQSEWVNLSDLVQKTLNHLRNAEPGRILNAAIKPEVRVVGDPGLLGLVVENLVSNAWKFTSKKAQATINFGTIIKDGETVYVLEDNGAGFDMSYSAKLFGAFQRLHNPSEFKGTGVGLATAKRIIERHGGKIWAEAAANLGAKFYFTLGKETNL